MAHLGMGVQFVITIIRTNTNVMACLDKIYNKVFAWLPELNILNMVLKSKKQQCNKPDLGNVSLTTDEIISIL